jgi:hypothetical protein
MAGHVLSAWSTTHGGHVDVVALPAGGEAVPSPEKIKEAAAWTM